MLQKEEKTGKEELPESSDNMFYYPPVFDIISIGSFRTMMD